MKALHTMASGCAACLASTFLFATDVQAQGFWDYGWHGFYLGGGGSYSTVSVQVDDGCHGDDCWWGDYDHYDEGDGTTSYAVHAGYRFNAFVAAEVNYFDTSTIRWDQNFVYMPEFDGYYNNHVNFKSQVTEVSALGILPFADIFEIYFRLGAGLWDAESDQRLDDPYGPAVIHRSVDDDGTGWLIGLGFGVTLADAWHLRLDLQTLSIDGDALNTNEDSSIDSVLFEVQYRFGARNAKATTRPSGPATATP
jgi:hypothetical protein